MPKKKTVEKLLTEVIEQYNERPFPIKTKTKCINNILKLHKEWRNLQKNILNYDQDKTPPVAQNL